MKTSTVTHGFLLAFHKTAGSFCLSLSSPSDLVISKLLMVLKIIINSSATKQDSQVIFAALNPDANFSFFKMKVQEGIFFQNKPISYALKISSVMYPFSVMIL